MKTSLKIVLLLGKELYYFEYTTLTSNNYLKQMGALKETVTFNLNQIYYGLLKTTFQKQVYSSYLLSRYLSPNCILNKTLQTHGG